MIRLALLLGGLIWVAMAFSPDLTEPVFTEIVAEATPEAAPAVKPEVTRAAVIDPVEIANPTIKPAAQPEPTPEPVTVVAEITPEPEPERIIWYVTGSRVNVREGPSTDYAILGKVIYGDAAEVISDPNAEWVKIRIEGDGVEGFIVKRFMAEADPLD